MKFNEYIQFLHNYLGSDMNRADYVLYITSLFIKDPETEFEEYEDENDSYNPLSGSIRKLERIYAGDKTHPLPKKDARKLRAKYDSSKFNEEMLALSSERVKVIVEELREMGVSANKSNYHKKCADIYYHFLNCLSEGIKEIGDLTAVKKEKKMTGCEHNGTCDKGQYADNRVDESIQIEAKTFYKEHENEIGLMPLCITADKLHPKHGNHRKIYNDYALQKEVVKKEICKLTQNDDIFLVNRWMNDAIEHFDARIFELELTTRHFLYDGGKYFYRAIEVYGNEPIIVYDPQIFKSQHKRPVYKKDDERYISLSGYMAEYLFDREPRGEYVPPWDWLWEAYDLERAPQSVVTNMVCIFIISACKLLVPYDCIENGMIWRVADYEGLLERQEDLYYYAALCLNAFYSREVKPYSKETIR